MQAKWCQFKDVYFPIKKKKKKRCLFNFLIGRYEQKPNNSKTKILTGVECVKVKGCSCQRKGFLWSIIISGGTVPGAVHVFLVVLIVFITL